jgi:hypothetical protein
MGMGLITVLVVPGGHVEPLRTSAEEGEDIRYDEEEEDEDDRHCEEEVNEMDCENVMDTFCKEQALSPKERALSRLIYHYFSKIIM